MKCERLAAKLRQALMAAPVISVSDERQPAFVRPPAPATLMMMTSPIATTLPRFAGFRDVHTTEESLSKVDNFCLINGIPTEDQVCRVIAAALDGSAKLWYRFAGPFSSWDDCVPAFRQESASVNEKKCLKN
ncbi:hypothetical protein MRX96_034578 [Rhipicephalus microplus]